jgi:glycosyltransferase involved in cell wall biosynthesis
MPANVLFVMPDHAISPDAAGGAAAVYYSHLELLAHYGAAITLVILADANGRFARYTTEHPEQWKMVQSWIKSHHLVQPKWLTRRDHVGAYARAALKADATLFPLISDDTVKQLEQFAKSADFIWSEHLEPTLLMYQFSRQRGSLPILYSHHDWRWRIKALRRATNGLAERLRRAWQRTQEIQLVRGVDACISGSATETEQIRALGAKLAGYFPTTYTPLADAHANTSEVPRIVHLGGMGTTANRIGLRRFLELVWKDELFGEALTKPELWVVGSLDGADEPLRRMLTDAGAHCTGYVPDLNTVLRPYDIHIIPWEHDTGTRTRIPVALNHKQVLLSTRAAAACLSELRNGEDCVLVDNLHHMAKAILTLISDSSRRVELATRGRQTFEREYTREAVQTRFNAWLDHCTGSK